MLYIISMLNENLQAELISMFRADQELRRLAEKEGYPPEISSCLQELDDKHLSRMRQIILQHGSPGKSLVGENGANCAWLLVQHADTDRDFQKRCLELMKQSASGEVLLSNIAYLTDRIRVGDNQPQVYGTQFRTDPSGSLGPHPIEDEEHVDERRALVGLDTFDEYRNLMILQRSDK